MPVQLNQSSGVSQWMTASRALQWLMVVIALIAYGSLLPFDFSPRSNVSLCGLTFKYGGRADTLTNLALYTPLGFLLFLVLPSKRRSMVWPLCTAGLVTTGLSLLMEWGQTWSLGRVGSWNDVRCNAIGGLLGAASALVLFGPARRWSDIVYGWMSVRPRDFIVLVFSLSLLFFHLLPFDVVRGTQDLRQSFLRAEWTINLARVALDSKPPFADMAHQFLTASWFGLLGFLMLRSERKTASCELEVGLRILIQGMGLIVVIEALQLFSRVHVFDVASIMLRVVALLLGAWVARITSELSQATLKRWLPASGIGCALVLIAIVILGESRYWPQVGTLLSMQIVDWPMESLWRLPTNYAVLEVAEAWAVFAPLTALLRVAWGWKTNIDSEKAREKARTIVRARGCVVMVALAAAVIEGLHAVTGDSQVYDLSEVVLAAGIAWITLQIMPVWHAIWVTVPAPVRSTRVTSDSGENCVAVQS